VVSVKTPGSDKAHVFLSKYKSVGDDFEFEPVVETPDATMGLMEDR
jgi:hypothetical protein